MSHICLPMGFRFLPTDEELLFYLRKKALGQPLPCDIITERDVYGKEEPWDLLTESQDEVYFFTKNKKKFSNRKKLSRVAGRGTWKLQQSRKIIDSTGRTIGSNSLLSFTIKDDYGCQYNMHEYALEHSEADTGKDYVICKVQRKFSRKESEAQRPSKRVCLPRQASTDHLPSPTVSDANVYCVPPMTSDANDDYVPPTTPDARPSMTAGSNDCYVLPATSDVDYYLPQATSDVEDYVPATSDVEDYVPPVISEVCHYSPMIYNANDYYVPPMTLDATGYSAPPRTSDSSCYDLPPATSDANGYYLPPATPDANGYYVTPETATSDDNDYSNPVDSSFWQLDNLERMLLQLEDVPPVTNEQ